MTIRCLRGTFISMRHAYSIFLAFHVRRTWVARNLVFYNIWSWSFTGLRFPSWPFTQWLMVNTADILLMTFFLFVELCILSVVWWCLCFQLEEYIQTVSLSRDWVKLVGGCLTESSAPQSAASAAGSTQKHRSGRRGRKPSAAAEVAIDCQDLLSDFTCGEEKHY